MSHSQLDGNQCALLKRRGRGPYRHRQECARSNPASVSCPAGLLTYDGCGCLLLQNHFTVRYCRCMKRSSQSFRISVVVEALVTVAMLPFSAAANEERRETRLSIAGTQFTINGQPTFLLGISYYSALGASEAHIKRDLDQMQRLGFNWFRVWATWAAFSNDVS